jgi:hypothetical protein
MSQTPNEPGRRPPPSAPRWVKVSVVIAIILVMLFVLVHLTGIMPMGH